MGRNSEKHTFKIVAHKKICSKDSFFSVDGAKTKMYICNVELKYRSVHASYNDSACCCKVLTNWW